MSFNSEIESADIIFYEGRHQPTTIFENLDYIQDKYFIIFTNRINNFMDSFSSNAVVVPKEINYQGFLLALNSLFDRAANFKLPSTI